MMYSNLPILLALASTVFCTVYACSMPRGWKPKSLPERAKSAEVVFYGKVVNSPSRWYYSVSKGLPILKKKRGLYSAEVEIYCTFKGEITQKFLNVSGYGYLPGNCIDDHVIEGEKGIFFVRFDRSGQLVAHNVNIQRSTASVDGRTLMKIIKAIEMSVRKSSVLNTSRRSRKPRGGCPMIAALLW